MSTLSNKKLLKRAKYGAISFYVWGILNVVLLALILVHLFCIIDSEFNLNSFFLLWFPAIAMLSICISSFIMAVTSGRGSSLALIIALIVMAVQLIKDAFFFFAFNATTGIVECVLTILIMFAFAKSLSAMIEIRKRGLFEQAYGGKKPGKNLAVIGSSIFILGYLVLFVVASVIRVEMQTGIAIEKDFVSLVNDEGMTFAANLKTWREHPTPGNKKKLDVSFAELKSKTNTLYKLANEKHANIREAIRLYIQAIECWEIGIECFSSDPPDREKGVIEFAKGDAMRMGCVEVYNNFLKTIKTPGMRSSL